MVVGRLGRHRDDPARPLGRAAHLEGGRAPWASHHGGLPGPALRPLRAAADRRPALVRHPHHRVRPAHRHGRDRLGRRRHPALDRRAPGGIVVIVYFSAGGLVASAWVNLVQLVVLLAGFAVAIPWALSDIGGWAAIEATAARTSPDYLNLWQGGGSGWVYIALLAPAFIISPGLVQKVYGATGPRAIRIGLLAAGVGLVLFAFAPTLLGMIARVYDPALASREQALPMLLATALPPALGLLGLAAVFSAEVSSADAGLFMLSTSLSKDLYKGFLKPEATSRQVLRVARGAAIAGGTLGVLLALWLESVIASLTIFYSILSVSLFVPVAAGLHSRRAGVPEALAAIGAGLAALGAVHLFVPADAPALLDRTLIGLIVSAAAFALVAAVRRHRRGA
ncbi:MAG: hypothetical protein F4Z33_03950 [Gemmatimonadales bacterium]|nr:hypothetical protein [Gemmatimonadales bacterium]